MYGCSMSVSNVCGMGGGGGMCMYVCVGWVCVGMDMVLLYVGGGCSIGVSGVCESNLCSCLWYKKILSHFQPLHAYILIKIHIL